MENRVFVSEIPQEDLNRIDVLNEEENNSNHSVRSASSLGSRNRLTAEFIELSTNNSFLRRKSSFLNITNYSDARRIPTPTNMVRRWSQSISRFSKDKRSLREKTIYRLPSRMVFEADGKLISDDPDAELEQLVQEIEQHEYLMQDTALSKQSRLETLRALPQHLSTKRLLKAQLSIDIEKQHAKDPSTALKTVVNFIIAFLLKSWLILRKLYGSLEIWYSALKTIEGHFGSNVTSYFKFLRCLLVFNMFLLIFPLCFITLPQILYNDDLNRRRLYDNQAPNQTTTSWDFMDLLTGEGFLKSSLLFYGSYSNETFSYRNSHTTYSIPHAYYMTMLLLYLSTFIIISLSVARSYRRSFIEASGEARVLYAQKVFCAWDYSISHPKAAELKHLAICSDLKEILNQIGASKPKLSILWRIWIFFSHLITHFLVFIVISSIGVAIWTYLKQFSSTTDDSSWNKLTLATIVNTSILVFQALFSWISRLEDYRTPQRTLHITLVRNFILEFVIMALLVYLWLTRKNVEGWETAIGQEIYRLIISDFFISVLVLPVFKCFQIFVMLRFWPKCERGEFDISQESLGLVYNQTLLLTGLFFAPLLAAIIIVKMITQFYVNKAVLMYVCKSPQHVWRSAQTNTLYLLFTFLSLLGVIIALGYIMMQVPLSQESGPFRNSDFMIQIFIDGVLKLRSNEKIWSTLMWIMRPAVFGGILIIMSIMVYYLRVKSQAHCLMVKLLKEMLYLEAKDKEFLLAKITSITKERKWNSKNENLNIATTCNSLDDLQAVASGTWRYKRPKRDIISQHGSSVSMESAISAISTVNEGVLRNRSA